MSGTPFLYIVVKEYLDQTSTYSNCSIVIQESQSQNHSREVLEDERPVTCLHDFRLGASVATIFKCNCYNIEMKEPVSGQYLATDMQYNEAVKRLFCKRYHL